MIITMEVFGSVFPNSSVSTPLISISCPIVVSFILLIDIFVFILRTLNVVLLFDGNYVVSPAYITSMLCNPVISVLYM